MAAVGRLRREDGFLMVELLMTITIVVIALTALVGVFSSGIVSMGSSRDQTTASLLADSQMETYRTMLYRDIGLDLSDGTVATLDSTYTSDSACANAGSATTCSHDGVQSTESEPTGLLPDSCDTIDGWYSDTDPCVASRTLDSTTTPASPDGRPYRIDTYVTLIPAVTTGSSLSASYKEVTIVVRKGANLDDVLARETSDFDCSTGQNPNDSADC
jgi:type II secretory pathway pseudopilin PulG